MLHGLQEPCAPHTGRRLPGPRLSAACAPHLERPVSPRLHYAVRPVQLCFLAVVENDPNRDPAIADDFASRCLRGYLGRVASRRGPPRVEHEAFDLADRNPPAPSSDALSDSRTGALRPSIEGDPCDTQCSSCLWKAEQSAGRQGVLVAPAPYGAHYRDRSLPWRIGEVHLILGPPRSGHDTKMVNQRAVRAQVRAQEGDLLHGGLRALSVGRRRQTRPQEGVLYAWRDPHRAYAGSIAALGWAARGNTCAGVETGISTAGGTWSPSR